MRRFILVVICLIFLPGCNVFKALYTGANESGKVRELIEKRDVREELVFEQDHSELVPEYRKRVGLIERSAQIDINKDWLSNPNSYWGAVASLGGLVHPLLGLTGMGGTGGALIMMIIGFLRRKKELKGMNVDRERENEHKDRLHELEKDKIRLGPTVVDVPSGTLRGAHSLRMTLAADKDMKFYEVDTGKTFEFNGMNWEQI